jgi:hypothetical protein
VSTGFRAPGAGVLRASAIFWFVTAAIGQAAFAAYIAAFYGLAWLRGDWESWNNAMFSGLIAGDVAGNAFVFAHIALAFVITIGGPLQLIPQIRQRVPVFHRWNGRVYLLTAFVMSLGGLYLTWARIDDLPSIINGVAISLNGVLILLFGAMALRHAMAGNISVHHRWALRLFLAVSGVWFLRVMVMGWVLANQGPAGLGDRLEGPVGVVLNFASWALPLAVLELYFLARDRGGAGSRRLMAAGLALLTVLMGAGIMMAAMFMWLPNM